jgi:hypothetical protein
MEVVNKNENKRGHYLELIDYNTTYIKGAEYKWIPPITNTLKSVFSTDKMKITQDNCEK